MKFLVLGGGMSQASVKMEEYLDGIKHCYKDLVAVAKDPDSGEIRPASFAFKILVAQGQNFKVSSLEHPQTFMYVIVDPQSWHVTLFSNKFKAIW
jgi:hypothetical protein